MRNGNGSATLKDRRPTVEDAAHLVITPPQIRTLRVKMVGTSPYVQNAFSNKARAQMHEGQAAGDKAKSRTKRAPKDFQAAYEGACHKVDNWYGIPANGIRAAMIAACRVAGYAMTRAKMAVFVQADAFDALGTPLVKITRGAPRYVEHPVRNDNGGVDLRARPMWDVGWEAVVSVQFDADQFAPSDVANLLMRAGTQVGIGEGRAFSKDSVGQGWGFFTIVTLEE